MYVAGGRRTELHSCSSGPIMTPVVMAQPLREGSEQGNTSAGYGWSATTR